MNTRYKIVADCDGTYNTCLGNKQTFICTGCSSHGGVELHIEKLMKESVKKWVYKNIPQADLVFENWSIDDLFAVFESNYLDDIDATTYSWEIESEI